MKINTSLSLLFTCSHGLLLNLGCTHVPASQLDGLSVSANHKSEFFHLFMYSLHAPKLLIGVTKCAAYMERWNTNVHVSVGSRAETEASSWRGDLIHSAPPAPPVHWLTWAPGREVHHITLTRSRPLSPSKHAHSVLSALSHLFHQRCISSHKF